VTIADACLPSHDPSATNRTAVVSEARAILRLAQPIALIALVAMGMGVTDTVMVSRLFGAEALAAVAVGSDLYSILYYFGAGVLSGLAPFYTAAVVRADPADRARLERIGQVAVALVAAVLMPVVWTAPDWLAAAGLDAALLEQGRGYTRAMALTLLPMLGVVLYRTMLTAAEKPRIFLQVTLAMLPLNAVANHVLMTGAGPAPALGITGAGVSSFVVATASLAGLAVVARGVGTCAGATPVDWRGLMAVLRVGLPVGLTAVAEVGVFLGATIYAATLGAADVAAHTLALRTAGVAYAIPTALLQAVMVRMARAEALGDPAMRRAVVTSGMGLSLVAGIAALATLGLGSDALAHGFFGQGAASVTAALASGLLLLLAFMEFVGTPGSAAAGLLRGRKDTRAPMLFSLAGNWAVGAPIGIYLCEVEAMGIAGVWTGLLAGMIVTSLLTLARLIQTSVPWRPGV
jgi:MATE family multidrug resistance protein